MKGITIRGLLENDVFVKQHFDGIITKETLQEIKRDQHFVILNTNEHWTYIFRSNGTLECFDPLGWQLKNLDIFKHNDFTRDIIQVRISRKQYQPIDSENCGAYCIYLAYKRLYMIDQPFSDVLSQIFYDSQEKNEQVVLSFCDNLEREKQRQTIQETLVSDDDNSDVRSNGDDDA